MKIKSILLILAMSINSFNSKAQVKIFVNQVAFDDHHTKIAIIEGSKGRLKNPEFRIVNIKTGNTEFKGQTGKGETVDEWAPGNQYYKADFSAFQKHGSYRLQLSIADSIYQSASFIISPHALENSCLPAILHYYNKQRANTPAELLADSHVQLYGSSTRVDLRGGWCDASGDISKYFSHLAYANFMSPQQIPLVTWSLIKAAESSQALNTSPVLQDSINKEAAWGADYLLRSLSAEGYFYMTVFSYFNKNPEARRIVGLHANSITTNEYQAAFREGGGMAIAALARISGLKISGDFSPAAYLSGAKRAFDHLMLNNMRYDDDGKENIIDDYCALMAATELWIVTDSTFYRDQARLRARHLNKRIHSTGYFIADDKSRPFWHASDAGLPVIALCRYLDKETEQAYRNSAILTVKKNLSYQLKVSSEVVNPFGYARQTFNYQNKIQNGFFIPHDNETGWWWQGENARLGSLAAAALIGGKLIYSSAHNAVFRDSLTVFASRQLSWVLGCNPYSVCFMYGKGRQNVPYMQSSFGHGSENGGISNGITGKKGHGDGSGIDYKTSDEGNEWRWTEQWLPHAAWFLLAITAMAEN